MESGGLETKVPRERISVREVWATVLSVCYKARGYWLFVDARNARRILGSERLAERVGFEPTIRFPVYTLSKRAP